MKRFSIILFGALAMLMASCSKNVEPSPSDPDAWYTDISLPVPIEFGSSVMSTKADFINDLESQPKVQFGVFAINNDSKDLENDKHLLYNAYAVAKNGDFQLGSQAYYPLTNECYSFYAYYKVDKTGEEVLASKDRIYVRMPIAEEDILHGKAEATPFKDGDLMRYGFNGAYLRAVKKNSLSGYTPSFKLSHATTALQFYVKASENSSFETDDIWIDRIELLNLPVYANLCVVAIDNKEACGTFEVPNEPEYYGNIPIFQRSTKEKLYPKYTTNSLGQAVGGPKFLVPTSSDISGRIILKDNKTGTVTESELPFTIRREDLKIDQFEAGHRYNLNLMFHTPELIEISVSVDKWKDAFTNEDYDSSNPGYFDIDLG